MKNSWIGGGGAKSRREPEIGTSHVPAYLPDSDNVEDGSSYRQIVEMSPDAVFVHVGGKVVFANAALARLMAAESADQLVGMMALDIMHPDFRDRVRRMREEIAGTNTSYELHEMRYVNLNGEEVDVEAAAALIRWKGMEAYSVIARDITGRKRAERDIADKSMLLESTFECMGQGFCVFDAQSRLVAFNQKYVDIYHFPPGFIRLGMPHEEIIRKLAEQGCLGEGEGSVDEVVKKRVVSAMSGEVRSNEFTLHDGVSYIYQRRPMPNGGFVATFIDITKRKLAEVAQQESEGRFRNLIEGSTLSIQIGNRERGRIYTNLACTKLFGYESLEEIERIPRHELTAAHDRERVTEIHRKLFADNMERVSYEFDGVRKDGTIIPLEAFVRRLTWQGEEAIQRTLIDLTERKKAEETLRAREAQLRLITDNIPVMVSYIDRDYVIRFANKPYADYAGIPQDEIIGMHLRDVRGEEVFQKTLSSRMKTLAGEATSNEGMRRSADGGQRYLRTTRVPHFGDNGRVEGYFTILLDLTEDRDREEQLHQAQKMEIVGQLTGGVAHDFNNILMVVLGNLEILEDRASSGEDRKLIEKSMNAASQAAELTHQLLAYSRKQALAPKFIHINEHVERTASLLKRTLGETISLKTASEAGLWPCMADPAQLESAVMNLCLNARDAMAAGGNLVIECANARLDDAGDSRDGDVVAGDYVVLSVADTGCGMSPEVLARVFEPFFTTKEVGKGSGLGLSMIYGFAKQSGGHVSARSEEGKGTTISLYLPRAEQAPQAEEPPRDTDILRGSGETVLVIEDEANVRDLTVAMLKGLDYVVVDVPDAATAHAALADGGQVDLVLSDVVLTGGTSGPEFVAQARGTRPDLKVVFMSGYSAEAARNNGFLASGNVLLNKPFQRQQLAKALREALT